MTLLLVYYAHLSDRYHTDQQGAFEYPGRVLKDNNDQPKAIECLKIKERVGGKSGKLIIHFEK